MELEGQGANNMARWVGQCGGSWAWIEPWGVRASEQVAAVGLEVGRLGPACPHYSRILTPS